MTALADEISLYYCEDGTELPVEWPTEDARRYTWRWNEDHHPLPHPPLLAAIDRGIHAGGVHAYAEAGVDAPHMFRVWTIAKGFQYVRNTALVPDELGPFIQKSRTLAERYGGPCNVWPQYSLPRVQDACARLRDLPAESPVRDAAFLYHYAFHLTHIGGFTVLQPVLMPLQQLLAEAFGPEASLMVQEVGQGGPNATLESDQALWELGQLAVNDPPVRKALERGEDGLPAIRALPAHNPFRLGFEAYVDRYRWRAECWDAFTWTVGENPGKVLPLIARALNAPSPADATQSSLARRDEVLRRIEEHFASQPETLARVRALARAVEGYVGVREGRALWQMTAAGCLRAALLTKGRALLAAGMLDDAEDVLFLLPEEVDASTGGTRTDHRTQVAERRAEWEFWKEKRPPLWIGADPEGPVPWPMPVASEGPVLRGMPASRGTVTATVRVLDSLDEADSFQPGEVLVCVMTSPPWTPLFAVAAAVVTDSGAPLSHPAIAAREYGIPCVVGAKDATRKLRTGMRVTVDGLAGTVTIEE